MPPRIGFDLKFFLCLRTAPRVKLFLLSLRPIFRRNAMADLPDQVTRQRVRAEQRQCKNKPEEHRCQQAQLHQVLALCHKTANLWISLWISCG